MASRTGKPSHCACLLLSHIFFLVLLLCLLCLSQVWLTSDFRSFTCVTTDTGFPRHNGALVSLNDNFYLLSGAVDKVTLSPSIVMSPGAGAGAGLAVPGRSWTVLSSTTGWTPRFSSAVVVKSADLHPTTSLRMGLD